MIDIPVGDITNVEKLTTQQLLVEDLANLMTGMGSATSPRVPQVAPREA
jgi:hypothetical protein